MLYIYIYIYMYIERERRSPDVTSTTEAPLTDRSRSAARDEGWPMLLIWLIVLMLSILSIISIINIRKDSTNLISMLLGRRSSGRPQVLFIFICICLCIDLYVYIYIYIYIYALVGPRTRALPPTVWLTHDAFSARSPVYRYVYVCIYIYIYIYIYVHLSIY